MTIGNGTPEGNRGTTLGTAPIGKGPSVKEVEYKTMIDEFKSKNEALIRIKQKIREVENMEMPERFSKTEIVTNERIYSSGLSVGQNALALKGLTVAEFERKMILMEFLEEEGMISGGIDKFFHTIMRVEAFNLEVKK